MIQVIVSNSNGSYEMELKNYEPLMNLLYQSGSKEITKLLNRRVQSLKSMKKKYKTLTLQQDNDLQAMQKLSAAFKALQEKATLILEES